MIWQRRQGEEAIGVLDHDVENKSWEMNIERENKRTQDVMDL